ncbi:MAG TPA: glycosyltransferase family 4 protein [Elusimicrobiota bacterium]|nr:glycosyltransferase family 4 protein [Elusimicrobiota bacterium]
MKIAMVTPYPVDPRQIVGGVAGAAKYLVDELSKDPGIRITVVVPQGARQRETVREEWGPVTVYRLGRRGVWGFLPGTLYDIAAGRKQVNDFIRGLEPDIVHYQGATFLAAGCRRRNVLTIHGIAEKDALWEERGILRRRLKWTLLKLTEDFGRRRAPRVILISDYVREVLPENGSRKIWSIENPIADSFFDVSWEPEPGRIFCCSRIMARKNILGMIEAFKLLLRRLPHCRLRIAGTADPRYLRACRAQVEKDGLRSCVSFLGNLSVPEVQSELSKANCFAMPSFQETAPLSIAEAMAVGVPVVAAKVGGIPGMIEHGGTGFLLEPHDAAGIGDALWRISADDRLARSMGRRAKQAVRERYMASSVARRTVGVYREILEARGSSGGGS